VQFPRLPDWLVYGAVVGALALAALARRERADAPEAPPPPSAEEGALLATTSTFDPARMVKAPERWSRPAGGAAFSVSDTGVWLTARRAVAGCGKIALVESPGRAAEAEIAPASRPAAGAQPSDIAVLLTRGGAPPLSIADAALRAGQRGFHPGYPQGRAGELTSRLIGRQTLALQRDEPGHIGAHWAERVLAWAVAGRTDGLHGDLSTLAGAPVLNGRGEVVGVTLAESPRRGRIYTTTTEAVREAMARAKVAATPASPSDPITVENYGRAADGLRRDLRVAQLVCL
jgi:hypothetical protein